MREGHNAGQFFASLEPIYFETLHSELAAKMNFACSSFARTRLAPSSVRAFSK